MVETYYGNMFDKIRRKLQAMLRAFGKIYKCWVVPLPSSTDHKHNHLYSRWYPFPSTTDYFWERQQPKIYYVFASHLKKTIPRSTHTLVFQNPRVIPNVRIGMKGPPKGLSPQEMWVFPKKGVSQNGWFIMENPIKMDDSGVPLFLETPMFVGSNTDPHVRHDWKTRDNILAALFHASLWLERVAPVCSKQRRATTSSCNGNGDLHIWDSHFKNSGIHSHSKMMMILKWDDLINVWDSDIIIKKSFSHFWYLAINQKIKFLGCLNLRFLAISR